ncbi:hypothetical protein HZB74_01110 [Candidatus Saccharibacteria bacterium]|nr:hypothetical protein [Candidatus Saccharibacteria bacterium]
MSEKIHIDISNESHDSHKDLGAEKRSEHIAKASGENRPVRHEHKDKIDEIISKIEKSAKNSNELPTHQEDTKREDEYKKMHIGGQLRKQGLKQSVARIQKELPKHQRVFSKFIHNSKVDKISEATGATVARPSGLLAAGTFSLVASIGVLTICRYFGYEYNYLIGLVSLGAGFLIGIIFEGVIRIFKRA